MSTDSLTGAMLMHLQDKLTDPSLIPIHEFGTALPEREYKGYQKARERLIDWILKDNPAYQGLTKAELGTGPDKPKEMRYPKKNESAPEPITKPNINP